MASEVKEIRVSSNALNRVAVTGGSGFLGINLIRSLLVRNIEVVSLDVAPFDYPEKDRVAVVKGDIRDISAVREALDSVDAVVHCASALPLHSARDIQSIGLDGTSTVGSVAVERRVKRFVHISSTAVYGIPKVHPLYEDHPLVGVGPYGTTKIRAEAIAFEFRSQIPVTILRPKSFIGPERLGVFALLYDWAATGHNFPIPGPGTNLYQYLDVEDLTDAIWLALNAEEETASNVFNIGASKFGTFKDDFQAVLDDAGFGKKVRSIPAMPAIWMLRGLDKLNLSPLYPWVYETAVKDSYVSIDRAREILGFAPKYSNTDALLRNFRWYLDNLESFKGESGLSHRVPWKQGALSAAKALFR